MDQWHISISGQQRGPYERATVQEWHEQGRLPSETLVWSDHLESWRPIADEFGPGQPQAELQPPPPPRNMSVGTGSAATASPSTQTSPPSPTGITWSARPDGANPSAHAPLAPLGKRLGAVALDVIILWGAYLIAAALSGLLTFILGDTLGGILAGLLLIGVFLALIAWPIAGVGQLGETYGKHLLGLRVVSDTTRKPIGVGSAIARNLVQGVGLYVLGLGWLWAIWDEKQQGWHDKVVGSVVVDAPTGQRLDPLTHLRASFRGHA